MFVFFLRTTRHCCSTSTKQSRGSNRYGNNETFSLFLVFLSPCNKFLKPLFVMFSFAGCYCLFLLFRVGSRDALCSLSLFLMMLAFAAAFPFDISQQHKKSCQLFFLLFEAVASSSYSPCSTLIHSLGCRGKTRPTCKEHSDNPSIHACHFCWRLWIDAKLKTKQKHK